MIRIISALILFASVFVCVQPALADDQEKLTGVWHSKTSFLGVPSVTLTALQADGTFTTTMQASTGFASRRWGNYTVGKGTIRFRFEGHEPTEYCGAKGCENISPPTEETVFFRFLNADTIITMPLECLAEPCDTTATRVR